MGGGHGEEGAGGADSPPSSELEVGLNPTPQDHNPRGNQESDTQPTATLRLPTFSSFFILNIALISSFLTSL